MPVTEYARVRRVLTAPITWLRTPAPLDVSARRLSVWQALLIIGVAVVAYLGWPTVTGIRAMSHPITAVTDWWSALSSVMPTVLMLVAMVPSFGLLVFWLRSGRSVAGVPRGAPLGPAKTTYIVGLVLMVTVNVLYGALTGSHSGESPMPGWPAVVETAIRTGYSSVIEELVVVAVPALALMHARAPRWTIIVTAMLLRGPYHLYHGWYALIWAAVWSGGLAALFLACRRLLPLIAAHAASNTFVLGVSIEPDLLPHSLRIAVATVVVVPAVIFRSISRSRSSQLVDTHLPRVD